MPDLRPHAVVSWRRVLFRALLLGLVCTATVAFFFRNQIANGFHVLSGDRYDAVIELALLEHWRNVLGGASAASETLFFYPVHGALGYNDGYLLFGLVYSLFRAAGLDPYLSGELVNVVLRAVCFLGMYAACRRILALGIPWALLAAVLATLSENMSAQALHAQLFSVGLVPWMAVILDAAAKAFLAQERRRFLACTIAAALLFGAWLLTAFYTAWFFVFFFALFAAASVVLAQASSRERWRRACLGQLPALATAAVLMGLSLVPFLLVYLPKALETGQHGYNEVLRNTPSVLDLVNVGANNLFYGPLVARMSAYFWPPATGWSEQVAGFPLVLLALFVSATVWLWRRTDKSGDPQMRLAHAMAIAVIASWLLMIHVGNVSAWAAVYALFPGARAIRVVSRYQLLLALPVIAVATLFLARQATRTYAAVLVIVCVALIGEQIDTAPPLALIRDKELAHLNAVPPPPRSCRAFFASSAWRSGFAAKAVPESEEAARMRRLADRVYSHNVDAMMIAETRRIPTLNGFATFVPPGWDLADAAAASYRTRVARYARRYGVQRGLCALDLDTLRWDTNPFEGHA